MSSEVPIEIEDKQTAVSVMRELVEKLQGTTIALKREIAPQSQERRIPQSPQGHRGTPHHCQAKGSNTIALSAEQ
jgi:hypothetical protein